ncbi:MAG TPA: ABC-ATPase domain-containing protein, partial [Candidatus Marinimicrobia bacterium]|nr:ABC-ATPase domain-containing protein [Candidatus Neomarinimicrobiota bacterium]
MFNEEALRNKLKSIDGRDYGTCQSLKSEYDFSEGFKLVIHQIPKDPYAPPHTGIYRVIVDRNDDRIIDFKAETKI